MREKIKAAWFKLLHEEATPNKIATGFAIGLFMAFFPAPVLETFIALGIAYVARANRAACLIGNNFVLLIFPIIPFVFGTEYLIGRMLLQLPQGAPLPRDWNFLYLLQSQGPNYRALVVGALVLAVPSSLIGFFGVKIATTRWQARRNGNATHSLPNTDGA